MADLVTRLKLDNSQYNSNIDSAKEKTREFQGQAEDASKSVNELGNKGAKSASDLLKEMGKIEGAGRSASNYKRQLAELQKTITDLTIAYRGMSDEMKSSPIGQEVAAKIQELTQKAAEYKDAIGDVQQEIQKMASDTAAWDGMKMGIETVSSALQGFVATGVLGEKTTEQLVDVLAKLKAAETATNAVINIGNALQKNSALMTSIATLQTKALAKAKVLETSATKGATIAQKAFNLVAKANPYVLLATAIIAVGTAIVTFTKRQNEATAAEKKQQEEMKKQEDAAKEWAKKVGDSSSSLLSKYRLLQIEWSKLQTTAQKKRWITENKNEFENLGLKVNDVISAESTFVGNTTAIVDALKKRALAAARQAQMTELYGKLIEAQTRAESEYNRRAVSAGSKVGGTNHSTAGGNEFVDRTGNWVYTTKGAEEANKRIKKEVYATANQIQAQIDDLAKEIAGSIDISTIFKNSGGGSGDGIKAEVGSLQEAQDQVNKLQTLLNNMSPDNPKFEETKRLLFDAQKNAERLKELLKEAEPPKTLNLVPNSLEEANYFVSELSKELNSLDPGTDEFKEIVELLNFWKKRQEEINKLIRSEVETLADKYKKIASDRDAIQFRFDIGEIDEASARKQIQDLNNKLSKLGLKADLKLEIDEDSIKTISKQLNSFVSSMDKVGSVGNAVGAINSVYESISQLGDKLSEAQNGWESFFAIFETGMTIFNAVATIIKTVATVTELLTAAKQRNTTATNQESVAAIADASAQGTDAGAAITNAAAHGAEAGSKGASAVASTPFVGPILAIAAIASIMAAVIGMIASAKGFANGGIVDAASKYGDKNIVRVNGGEMILTTRQQENLFKLLDEGRVDRKYNFGGDVEFKVKGTELIGVLNNINKKNSKL